jgi:hypothetical protein
MTSTEKPDIEEEQVFYASVEVRTQAGRLLKSLKLSTSVPTTSSTTVDGVYDDETDEADLVPVWGRIKE